jgi:hypothetical protein
MVSGSGGGTPADGASAPPRTPWSWVLVGVAIAALYAGGVAVVGHLWALFWACTGIAVLAVLAGKFIGTRGQRAAMSPGVVRPPSGHRDS